MGLFFCVLLQVLFIYAGVRSDERSGVWRWSLFIVSIGFALLEVLLLFLPAYVIHDTHNPVFWPVYSASWLLAIGNFVWFLRVIKRRSSAGAGPGR